MTGIVTQSLQSVIKRRKAPARLVFTIGAGVHTRFIIVPTLRINGLPVCVALVFVHLIGAEIRAEIVVDLKHGDIVLTTQLAHRHETHLIPLRGNRGTDGFHRVGERLTGFLQRTEGIKETTALLAVVHGTPRVSVVFVDRVLVACIGLAYAGEFDGDVFFHNYPCTGVRLSAFIQ